VHLVVLTIGIYYDARPYERQMYLRTVTIIYLLHRNYFGRYSIFGMCQMYKALRVFAVTLPNPRMSYE